MRGMKGTISYTYLGFNMSYGFSITNINNILQIDSGFTNLEASSPVTVMLHDGWQQYNEDSLMFVRPTGGRGRVAYLAPWRGFWRQFIQLPNISVDYIRTKVGISTPDSSTFGMQVFKSNGETVFDSRKKYLDIIHGQVFKYTNTNKQLQTYRITLPTPPAGKKYYALANPLAETYEKFSVQYDETRGTTVDFIADNVFDIRLGDVMAYMSHTTDYDVGEEGSLASPFLIFGVF